MMTNNHLLQSITRRWERLTVPHSAQKTLAAIYEVTPAAVSMALSGKRRSKKAREIREAALREFSV